MLKEMPITLYDINETGFAEPIRFVLAYSKINFNDVYLSDVEWNSLKSSM